ncbi:serine/threonine-protein kinase ULK1a [Lampris incognitus]|uniref:serine/threonine-protein kinase ULK1a n=1 Tax=Lampris incognitus TaxID=2546036 RepID=UPI0024B59795|nr:serine/threonine-protein kinase ULK1a [Lampris incognitus]
MESIGKFEFNRRDLIGHGAFAVVFKGRHKEKRNYEVAVKCINKKNLAKSQSLLGKEIKILKELKHENIVGLLDYQEMGGCVYLVMEYCNGGDLAEYLHSKGTLSEDTIRVFLQQIAEAMKVLQSKGILHRDLKPQNILLCHREGARSSPINTCIKIADFGFARHLQTNTMAATLCGSPMYMAPEVIMSQNYDAKADLWSIGTIVYQCLTGKAPFHASTPQELRLFYESNRNLLPSIPRETSSQLQHLLLGLLQRNDKERMNFAEFFHHPFLELSSSSKKFSPAPMLSYPSSGSGSSCSSSSTSHLASPQHSDGEMHQFPPKALPISTKDTPGFLLKDVPNQESGNTSSCTDDYVMVPAEFPSDYACTMGDGSPIDVSLIYSGKPFEFGGSNYHQSVPIPVPTQIHNYQRMEQNQQPAGLHGCTKSALDCAGDHAKDLPRGVGCGAPGFGSVLRSPRPEGGGAQPHQSSPLVSATPKTSEQTFPLSTRTEMLAGSPVLQHNSICRHKIQKGNTESTLPGSQSPKVPVMTLNQRSTVLDLQTYGLSSGSHNNLTRTTENKNGPFKKSLSTGRLSDMLLKAVCGAQLLEGQSDESLSLEKGMDTAAPSSGCYAAAASDSSTAVVFTVGSPSCRNTPPDTNVSRMFLGFPSYISSARLFSSHLLQRGACRESDSEVMDATPHSSLVFHPPELPEDTLIEQAHTEALLNLRFNLAFVYCVMEIASFKDPGLDSCSGPDVSFLQQSLVADQISLLSKEWSYAEQLVLYMKAEEFLSSALHTAKEDIKERRLFPSPTVKQVIRKLNELYKCCVTYCRSLNGQLQGFLLSKQKLMDRFSGNAAEKLIYNHTVHMVQAAALDEMFNRGTSSIQRYHKALLLMEGLSRVISEQQDIESIDKCKQCIERRLSALQTSLYP